MGMLDLEIIRSQTDTVKKAAHDKGVTVDVDRLLELDVKRRELQLKVDALRTQRNEHAATLKQGKPSPDDIQKGKELKEKITTLESELEPIASEFEVLWHQVPNIPSSETPIGHSEDENVVIRQVGEKPAFEFEPKNHWEIATSKDWIDKERAAKVAGSRFSYIKGDLVLLEFALWQFALHVLTDESQIKDIIASNQLDVSSKPFVPVLPPAVAKTEVYEATGRLNKEEQTYKLESDDLWLNASAEHTLAPMYMGEILDEKDLPIRYVGYTTAFRREAGTYGKDMEGILRQHQFNKLEMESFTTPAQSYDEHLFMVAVQEYLMQQLGLPYQVVEKCTADIGFPNAKGVDIEVWLPGQNRYRETHTADLITDFQTRRMQTRVRPASGGSLVMAHTNDATAFSERPLIAIIENNQRSDGTVAVPEVLQRYLGKESIG
jgi:seryl-tRNA synthetase